MAIGRCCRSSSGWSPNASLLLWSHCPPCLPWVPTHGRQGNPQQDGWNSIEPRVGLEEWERDRVELGSTRRWQQSHHWGCHPCPGYAWMALGRIGRATWGVANVCVDRKGKGKSPGTWLAHAGDGFRTWSAGIRPGVPEGGGREALGGDCSGSEFVGLDDAGGGVDGRRGDRHRDHPEPEQDGEEADAMGCRSVRAVSMTGGVHVSGFLVGGWRGTAAENSARTSDSTELPR
jgi:hypothetical protein